MRAAPSPDRAEGAGGLRFPQAAVSYDEAAVLAREVGRRLAERLDYVKLSPGRLADIGCATGDGIRELRRRYPKALPLAVDLALPMLRQVQARRSLPERLSGRGPRLLNADVRALPLAESSLDLIWSNLMLHWLDDPLPALKELHRTLAVDGLLCFALLGPDTLKTLRDAGASALRSFRDMHDWGDMLVAAGFADPVLDRETITLTYESPRGLLRDQRHLGVRDGLLGRLPWRRWRQVFRAWPSVEGRLAADFEIVYGHAWKAAPATIPDGRAIIRFNRP